MNKITEVMNCQGVIFCVGDTVRHQDSDAGTAKIISFRISQSRPDEIEAITDEGTAHIDFLNHQS
jgi:hypothetical protein